MAKLNKNNNIRKFVINGNSKNKAGNSRKIVLNGDMDVNNKNALNNPISTKLNTKAKSDEIEMNRDVKVLERSLETEKRASLNKKETKTKLNVESCIVIEKVRKGRKRNKDNVAEIFKKAKVEIEPCDVKNGRVLAVGMGDVGQLGLGPDVEEKIRPTLVSDLDNIVSISAGGLHTVCLNNNGEVFTWGCNDEGALGRITVSEEESFTGSKVPLNSKAVRVSAGDSHTAILTDDGRVFAWGTFRDNSGLLGFLEKDTIQRSPFQLLEDIPIIKIASGNNHLVMLTHSGHIYTCGCGECGQLGRIAGIFANRQNRHRDGIGTLLKPSLVKVYKSRKLVLFDDVWAGGYVTFARARDSGNIYGFGLNNYCQLGDEDTNMKFSPLLLKSFLGRKWQQFSAGQHHSVALDSTGQVYVMGRSDYGRLGLGKEELKDAVTPTLVSSLKDIKIVQITAGECMSLAVSEEGEVYAFGMGTSCQLGVGDEEDRFEPTLMSGKQLANKKVICAVAGGQHSVLLAIPK